MDNIRKLPDSGSAVAVNLDDKSAQTKVCGACHKELDVDAFSKKQWQLKSQRRCKGCIASDKPVVKSEKASVRETKTNKQKSVSTPLAQTSSPFFDTIIRAAASHSNQPGSAGTWIPTDEELAEIMKSLSSPTELAQLVQQMNDEGIVKSAFKGKPALASMFRNSPLLLHCLRDADAPTQHDIREYAKLGSEMTIDQIRALFCQEENLAEEAKVTMKAAKREEGTSCWVCLDDGPDEEGNPLVRDCGCRGDSGLAHLACLKRYAKSKGMMEPSDLSFVEHWSTCPHCLQDYQGDLAVALSDACLIFYDNAYAMFKPLEKGKKGVSYKVFRVLGITRIMKFKLEALEIKAVYDAESRLKGIEVGKEIISLFDQMRMWCGKDQYWQRSGLEIPRSLVFDTYLSLSKLCQMDYVATSDVSHGRRAIECMERAVDLSKEYQEKDETRLYEDGLLKLKLLVNRKQEGVPGDEEFELAERTLSGYRSRYNKSIAKLGIEHAESIEHGAGLGGTLIHAGHKIEAERLLKRLIVSSNRILGPEHPQTTGLKKLLVGAQFRQVLIYSNPQSLIHKKPERWAVTDCKVNKTSLRYSLLNLECKRDLAEYSVDHDDPAIMIQPGTPVVCMGLKSAMHLNGKIGDVRRQDENTGRYLVHFADPSLKPTSVLPANLRILIEVPDENSVSEDSLVICSEAEKNMIKSNLGEAA